MQAPDTNESDSCDSDFEVMEGMQKETKTGNGVPTSMTQSCSPDIGVSDNEHDKDEDEKDLILVHHETPKGHEQPPRASSSQYMHHPPMPFLEGQGGAYTSFTPNAHSHDARSRETYDPKYKLLVIVLCLSMAHCVPYNPFKVLLSVILYAVMHCILLEIVHCTTQKQQRRNDAADEMLVYVISNTINATFVVSHFTYSVYCAAYEQCVDMSPRSSVACISFGLFLSHLCRFIWQQWQLHPHNDIVRVMLTYVSQSKMDLCIVCVLIVFHWIGGRTIDLLFIYCLKSLMIVVIHINDTLNIFFAKDVKMNIVAISTYLIGVCGLSVVFRVCL